MIYTKGDLIEIFRPVVEANDAIQDWVSIPTTEPLPNDFLKLLSDLDWAIRNTDGATPPSAELAQ